MPLKKNRPPISSRAERGTAVPSPKPPKKSAKTAKQAKSKVVKGQAATIYARLSAAYPDAHCALDFKTPFQLLAATILSAQCTDKRVNMVTPVLFKRYPAPADLAAAKPEDVEAIIKSTGFFR